METLKTCTRCERELPRAAFNRQARSADGLQWWCRECAHAHYRSYISADIRRQRHLRRNGLDEEVFGRIMDSQDGCCAVCQKELVELKDTHVDHCHDTLVIRGVLCHNCNVALGLLRDDPERIRRLAEYVEAPPTSIPFRGHRRR